MQVLETPIPLRPQRSLSYNDLKRRRLQRSASHKKIILPQPQPATTRRRHLTEQKSLVSNLPKDEKVIEGVIYELKGVLGEIRRKKSEKCFFSLRDSMTDRPSVKEKVEKSERKVQPLWSNVEEAGQTRQFIRGLLNKNKNPRPLVKLNQVRDKLKMKKQKSRSHQKSQHKQVKQIISPFKTKAFSKELPPKDDQERQLNKLATQKKDKQDKISTLERSLEELTNCPAETKQQVWKEEIAGKENQEKTQNLMDLTSISEIKKREEIGEPSQTELCFEEKTHQEGSFLRLMGRQDELEVKVGSRQSRRRSELERVRRIFPAGFFKGN